MMKLDDESNIILRERIQQAFSEDLMIGLAVILACVVILPIIFTFSHAMLVLFDYINYIIIIIFILEYLLKLYIAESRREFVLDIRHVLDLFIIVIALLDLTKMEFVPHLILEQGKLSPVLRLLRVFLTIALAGRTAERVKDDRPLIISPQTPHELQIGILDAEGNRIVTQNTQSIHSIPKDKPLWVDLQSVTEKNLDFIKERFDVHPDIIENKLIRESFPRIECNKDNTLIFLWDSRLKARDYDERSLNIVSNDMLIICEKSRLLTISTRKSDLFEIISSAKLPRNQDDFAVSIMHALFQKKIEDYGAIVQRIERKTLEFEEIPVNMTSPQFLETTFHFRKEIQKIISNLWHFKKILEHIKDSKATLNGIDHTHDPVFDSFYDEAEYICETAQNIKESLISLIELHINTVSYDMNRVMKVIAVITCLAVIPSTIGGLLGENLMDQPYQVTINEVFFVVASLMLLGLYVFYKKNWLR